MKRKTNLAEVHLKWPTVSPTFPPNAFGFSSPGETYTKMCENRSVVLLGETKEKNKKH